MTRLLHVHALIRHAARHRIPAAHGPAYRLTALATGAALATTVLAAAPSTASAAGRGPSSRQPVPAARTASTSRPASISEFAPKHDAAPAQQPGTAPIRRPRPPAAGSGHLSGQASPAPDVSAGRPATPPRTRPGTEPEHGSATALDTVHGLAHDLPESVRLRHRVAEDVLRVNGIEWRSSGRCSDRTITSCTSFENVRWGTIKGIIRFAESSGCEITVTGGTERGHAGGPHSHWKGYKLDIATSACVDRAIKRYPRAGVRGDGARLYRSPDGTLFAREKDHWDIAFR